MEASSLFGWLADGSGVGTLLRRGRPIRHRGYVPHVQRFEFPQILLGPLRQSSGSIDAHLEGGIG